MKKILTIILFFITISHVAYAKETLTELQTNGKVDSIYKLMPLEERIAQLRCMKMEDLFTKSGELDTAKCAKLIPYGIGHFAQYASQQPLSPNELRDHVAKVQAWLMTHTPNRIPALFHEEVLTGINAKDATIYPQQIGQACSFNTELAELKTRQTATNMRRIGGVLSLSPMVDVCRVPSFNRLEESYGEDSYLSAVMGTAFVRGLQMGDLKKGVAACSKHYLGYGGGGGGGEKEILEEILLPHETMIRLAGSKALMPGYHAVHGICSDFTTDTKCVGNKEILTDILRGYLGFDGMVVSDYSAVKQVGPLPTINEGDNPLAVKAAMAINAGNDTDFPRGECYAHLPEAIKQGLVSYETLERAVKDVLRMKYRCGLFDKDAYLYSNDDIQFDSKEERKTSYDIASQSVVLLTNNGVLPLNGKKKILLTGPNANSMWAMCGDYTYPSMAYFWKKTDIGKENPHIATLKEGMERVLSSQNSKLSSLRYSRGCDWTETVETQFQKVGDERAWDKKKVERRVDSGEKADADEALKMAKKCDVIVAAMGENVMLCGENRDRKGVKLPGSQEDYVKRLIATGKPVVLVVFGGRAQVIADIADKCAAIIQAWYPGEEGGDAVADILYGKVNPSGKLSVSYPNVEVNEPICYNRSTEQDSRVAWPFGYGQSYTTFKYSSLRVEDKAKTSDDAITVSFDITNTGKMAGDDVAQLYLSPKDNTQHIRPIQLQGFARVHLDKGETKTVSIRLHTEQFGYYSHDNDHRQWNIAPGQFTVKIGASSMDIRLQHDILLSGYVVVKPLRDYYFSEVTSIR